MMTLAEASDYIESAALRLGANAEQCRQWRLRGRVASAWHLRIVEEAEREAIELPREALTDFMPSRFQKNGEAA